MLQRIQRHIAGLRRRANPVSVWHHEAYRLPLADLPERTGIEPRRADLALWAIEATGHHRMIRRIEPRRAPYGHLGLVHTSAWLESMSQPDVLARVLGVESNPHLPVDPILGAVRLAVGGTVEAARFALRQQEAAANLLGGFHHAAPDRGASLCPLNDIAVAIAVLRADGHAGPVAVLDLDAHPPDGLAACLHDDPGVWVGSISASDWGPLTGVDETLLPPGTTDGAYLAALRALLRRLPDAPITFVIAGGDVLAGDRMGQLALTLDGLRERDDAVARRLSGRGSVWLPGGGYQSDSWRALASTLLTLIGPAAGDIPADLDPLTAHFDHIAARMDPEELGATEALLTAEDLSDMFGGGRAPAPRLLGYYTEEGLEAAFHAYGLLAHVRRLGYRDFELRIDHATTGDRLRLTGDAAGQRHLLVEEVVEVQTLDDRRVVFVHWLTLRHPIGSWVAGRPPLPGQDAPGLGLAREAAALILRTAERLGLDGIAFRPAWAHTAMMVRDRFRFLDPVVQGTFEALVRDLGHLPLHQLTRIVDEGSVLRNGEPWSWDPAVMVWWRKPGPLSPDTRHQLEITRQSTHFERAPAPVTSPRSSS